LCSQGNPAIEISDEQPESDVSDREYFGKDYFRIWLSADIFFDSLGQQVFPRAGVDNRDLFT